MTLKRPKQQHFDCHFRKKFPQALSTANSQAATAHVGSGPGGAKVRNLTDMLGRRESYGTATSRFTGAQRAHVTAFRSLPMVPAQQVCISGFRVLSVIRCM
jgi:hypothetical protein